MNKREIFWHVYDHLLAQNRQATYFDGVVTQCVYRTDDGLKCAIGCLIPDDDYHPDMEDHGFDSGNMLNQVLRDAGIDVRDDEIFALLHDLRMIHDNFGPDRWEKELTQLGINAGIIELPEPELEEEYVC